MEQLDLNHILNRNEIKSQIIDFLEYFQNNKKELITQRGIYLHGSSGIGKTRFVKELLLENNYDIIYYDASNMRNKNIIENISKHNISDTNILSMFHKQKRKNIIIMDEVDGMNGGDKGGINNLIKLIRPKKTKKQKQENYIMIPIICISNNRVDKKINELKKVCKVIHLKDPTQEQIETIFKEAFPKLDKTFLNRALKYVESDFRKIDFLYKLYTKNPSMLEPSLFDIILNSDSFNENTKEITKDMLKNKYTINQHSCIVNETDRTSVSLLFHENIIEILDDKNMKESILFYLDVLENITFSDYIDRITFQKQVWIFNEMTSLIKLFYNNRILHCSFEKFKTKVPNTIRFTKVLTKYSTEYNNNVFIDGLCQKLNIDKKDLYLLFMFLRMNYGENEIQEKLNPNIIGSLDINRMFRFLDNIYCDDGDQGEQI